MRAVVTGGAGFIGSHVCEALVARGYQVYCLDNFNDYYVRECGELHKARKESNLARLAGNPNFSVLRDSNTARFCDITEPDTLEALLPESFDTLVHLAAQAGVRAKILPSTYWQANVIGTDNILRAATKRGAKNIIAASSSSVYGDNPCVPWSESSELKPHSTYARTKVELERLCEKYARKSGASTTILRFFTVYGPRGRPDMFPYKIIDAVERGVPIAKFGDGTSERDYTYVQDVVDGIICAVNAGWEHEVINLGSNLPVTLNQFISVTEAIIGRRAQIIPSPEQPADVRRTYADISKAQRMLNWAPKTTIENGLTRMYDWYRKARIEANERAA